MEDLLNEKDFLTKPYNPRRRFLLFYIILFVFVIALYAIGKSTTDEGIGMVIVALFFASPVVLSIIMICGKKETLLLPAQTIFFALAGMYVTHLTLCAALVISAIYKDQSANITFPFMGAFVVVYLVLFSITCAIIFGTSYFKKKN